MLLFRLYTALINKLKIFRSELTKEEKDMQKDKEKEKEKEEKEKETEKKKDVEKQIETKEKTIVMNKTGTAISTKPESPNLKHLGRQKHVEQITITATSPVSPCQVITVTNSDHSSSPPLSSISSQVLSTENGQPTGVLTSPQPLMTTPTVERLLPIGTIVRGTGKHFYAVASCHITV